MLGKLLLMAGCAIDVVILGQEALRADWLLTLVAGEALLMKRISFILDVLCTCQNGFVTGVAAGSILTRAAFTTQDPVIFSAERLLGQILIAFIAAETVFMPVTTLMVKLL